MIRAFFHWLRRGHFPEDILLGPALLCAVCDVGTPTGSSIRPTRTMIPVPFA